MKARLRIPSVLAVAILGCDGGKSAHDAAIAGDGCAVLCAPDGTDAGVCPDPFVCVSAEAPHVCPAGCMCSAYCFPRTPEGERNCPTDTSLQCASPERTARRAAKPSVDDDHAARSSGLLSGVRLNLGRDVQPADERSGKRVESRCASGGPLRAASSCMMTISEAFEELVEAMTMFEAAWLHDAGRTTVRALIDDALLKASASLALLEPARVVEEVEYVRTHETHRAVLKVGMFLVQYVRADRDAPVDAIARARAAVTGMLDALAPYVLRKDNALRRVLIDNVPFDDAVAQLALAG